MKPFLLFILISLTTSVIAQEKKLIFYDKDWKPSTAKKYSFIVEQKKLNDTCWEWNYYEFNRPRFLSIQFKNQAGGTPHGDYVVYTGDGFVDSSGEYANGKRNGEWNIMASNHRLLRKLEYKNDVVISTKDSAQVHEERKRRDDSIKRAQKDTSEIESGFPGGLKAWQRFIVANFSYPKESFKSEAQGTVYVQFIVEKDGSVSGVDINKSTEYYVDQEAMRIMRASPKWTPAVQFGKPVRSYKRQPVTFTLQR
jgi:protein TonB